MRTPITARRLPAWDYPLFITGGLLCVVSLVALRSASATLDPLLVTRQATWIGLGILAGFVLASSPYPRWISWGFFLYSGVLALLLVVLLAGTVKLGAARWVTIFGLSIQPAELAKLATACGLARYLANQPVPLPTRSLLVSCVVAAVPAAFVFLQPDLGSALVLGAIWFGMVWVAGLSIRHLRWMMAAMLVVLPIAWHGLKDYQRMRLVSFVNPHADPLGAGYAIIQSQIAIGSGKLLGRGWLAGTQSQLNFLPERHADFLYAVIGEEWGFIGAVIVVGLFGVFVWRATRIALRNSEPQGRLLAMGLVSWLAFQAVMNMGMVMRVVPVVGVPLPMVSYGGSAMLVMWMALGLLQSIHRFGTRF